MSAFIIIRAALFGFRSNTKGIIQSSKENVSKLVGWEMHHLEVADGM